MAAGCGGTVENGGDAGVAMAPAEGGGGDGGGNDAGDVSAASSCINSAQSQSGSSPGCTSCVESRCASQVSGFESACSAYLSCVCPGGAAYSVAAATSSACMADEMQPGCQSASTAVGSCASSSCMSECQATSSSGSGSSSGSSSGGPTTGSCSSLSTCCGTLPSADQSGCDTIASANDQAECQSALNAYVSANLCP
jgi:hypothetical protein